MKKEIFLERLEELLQDIPEEEKRDAIGYYRDYLEEAGPEDEERVLAEFQSPEHIAQTIRAELRGELEQEGEFTERGFQDGTYVNGQTNLSRVDDSENQRSGAGTKSGEDDSRERFDSDEEEGKMGDTPKSRFRESLHHLKEKITSSKLGIVLIVLLVLVCLPLGFSILRHTMGSAFAAVISLVVLLILLAVLTLAAFTGGIALFILGILSLFKNFALGLMLIGLGITAAGVCLLLICGCILFYGVFLPWAFKSIIRLCRQLAENLSARA